MEEEKINVKPRTILKARILSLFLFFWFLIVPLGSIYIVISKNFKFSNWDYAGVPLVISFVIFIYAIIMSQENIYDKSSNTFSYSLKTIDFLYKKKPYETIRFDEIKEIKKIATKIGVPVLLKIYTEDGKIHYIGNKELQGSFMYALKERDLKDLIQEERREISIIGKYLLRLKGGKIKER